MARKKRGEKGNRERVDRYFLDTSILFARITGYDPQLRILDSLVSPRNSHVAKYVLMEFRRAVLLPLVHFYFLLAKHRSPRQAIAVFSQDYSARHLKVLLHCIGILIQRRQIQDDYVRVQRAVRTLIREWMVWIEGDDLTKHDTIGCQYADTEIGDPPDSATLGEFVASMSRFTPRCASKQFWDNQKARVEAACVQLGNKETKPANEAKQRLEDAISLCDPEAFKGKCKGCWKLGDAIIVLECPKDQVALSTDAAFELLGEALLVKVKRIPSVIALDRWAEEEPTATQPDADGASI